MKTSHNCKAGCVVLVVSDMADLLFEIVQRGRGHVDLELCHGVGRRGSTICGPVSVRTGNYWDKRCRQDRGTTGMP